MCSVAVRARLRLGVLTLAASALLLTAGCQSHYVAHGSALYADGHYVEAAEVFEQTEQRLASSSNNERARFGLYRGATFLKLGDVDHAARWLGYARAIVKADHEALDGDDRALLDASLRALGNGQPAAPGKTDSEVATAPAASQAAPTQ
jgi:hypothetical protein